jgi:hypothetical protein
LRYFGDGYQKSKLIDGVRYWRIPVMDGEFLCEDRFGTVKGVAGGNLLICGVDQSAALSAAEHAAAAIRKLPDVILPFPGGIVRSGSKVGSRYKKLKASTNDAYCPTLRGLVPTPSMKATAKYFWLVVAMFLVQILLGALVAGNQAGLVYNDWPLFVAEGEETRCVGDVIAAVAADDYRTARRALELIEVDYDVLPAIATAKMGTSPIANHPSTGFSRISVCAVQSSPTLVSPSSAKPCTWASLISHGQSAGSSNKCSMPTM